MTNITMTLAEFEHLLDVHGSDRTRWPLHQRSAALALLAHDDTARRLLSEADALDRVLAAAPGAQSRSLDALAARIVASAASKPRLATATSVERSARVGRGAGRGEAWRAAALLAASLLVGVFVGVANPAGTVTTVFDDLRGETMTLSALGSGDYLDEDTL
jgi:hypothetical protein